MLANQSRTLGMEKAEEASADTLEQLIFHTPIVRRHWQSACNQPLTLASYTLDADHLR